MTHPSRFPDGPTPHTCGTCAWHQRGGCLASVSYGEHPPPMPPTTAACAHHQPVPSCDPCGACCREAFDAVPSDGGGLPSSHTTRLSDDFRSVRRVCQGRGTRCICLFGDGVNQAFRCSHYAVRPTACRDLEAGSENCLLARRRVGLAPEPPAR